MKRILILFIINVAIFGCATVSSPVGGIKDEQHPTLIKSSPKDQSTNFNGKEIVLLFDEWMKKENIEKQLIITPRSEIDYEYKLKKEEFRLIFNEQLKDSTTYTLNFREGLKDITEGNVWENPRISFSTGNFLDSMKIQGNIKSLMTNQVLNKYTIGLYDPKVDTSNLRQGEPIYFTTTDEEGNYLIQNIKAGNYLLYGFLDSNDNLINESSKEPFTYETNTIDLTKDSQTIDLLSMKVNQDTLALSNATSNGKDFVIKFNKGLRDYQLTNIKDTSKYIYSNLLDETKTIQLYIENFLTEEKEWNESDSLAISINVTDSIGNNLKDTVYAKYRKSNIVNEVIKVKSTSDTKLTGTHHNFQINLNKPVHTINYDSISLKYGNRIIRDIKKEDIELNKNKNTVSIQFKLTENELDSISKKVASDISQVNVDTVDNKGVDTVANISTDTTINITKEATAFKGREQTNVENKQAGNNATNNIQQGQNIDKDLHLYIGKAAFTGLEKDSIASLNYKFEFKKLSNFGTISGQIIGTSNNFIIELLKENYTLVDTIRNTKDYLFNWVAPGKYRIRVIVDKNNNGKWDAGNPILRTASERVIHFQELLTVKANWEIIEKNIKIDDILTKENIELGVDK